jgi:hypothetical protein
MTSRAALWIRLSVSVCLLLVLVTAPAICAAADDPPTAEADHARPMALSSLYVSFAGLQGLDLDSTMRARAYGAREINPVVGSALGSMPRLVGMKAGATMGIIFVSERLRAHHPVAAILLMTALNAAYGVIVVHNYSLAHP